MLLATLMAGIAGASFVSFGGLFGRGVDVLGGAGSVGTDSAPLEVMQAGVMVQCWATMAPLEVLQGHASAVARSREELLVFLRLFLELGFLRDSGQKSCSKL